MAVSFRFLSIPPLADGMNRWQDRSTAPHFCQGAQPVEQQWHVQAQLHVDADAFEREVRRKAAFLVATNVLDQTSLADLEVIQTYNAQSAVERGFAFLKDLLFLASSVFVKKPRRSMALAFIMVVCLLVYRLAEGRVRQRLAATAQTVPD